MTEMNEKEAREIVKKGPPHSGVCEPECFERAEWNEAAGYIARLSQEKRIFGPIVEVLDECIQILDSEFSPVQELRFKLLDIVETFYKEFPEWKK